MIDLKVELPSWVRFQGIASLAPEKTLYDAAEVAGIARTDCAILQSIGKRKLQ